MCKFFIQYSNGSVATFSHITKATYVKSTEITVEEKDLLTHLFPCERTLHLFSNDSNFTVAGKDIVWIEARKED